MYFPATNTKYIAIGLLLIASAFTARAQVVRGVVMDTLGKPLAFATIKKGGTKQGSIADLHGNFSLDLQGERTLLVSYTGFKAKTVIVGNSNDFITVTLTPQQSTLQDVVILSNDKKLRRILNNTINNRDRHNPDKYDWYRCNVYYKMTADIRLPDSLIDNDTSKDGRMLKQLVREQHLFMTETYSRRTWEAPQRLQEEIVASRVSGFKKAIFNTLVTDVLPFHTHNDFISMNGKNYHNPIAKGLFSRFRFKIQDEIINQKDTIWLISFSPRNKQENLSGTLYIQSDGFATSHLIANHYDSILKRELGLEHQYQKQGDKWFPHQLNYYVSYQGVGVEGQEVYVAGTSMIDSVRFIKDPTHRFDRAHTVKLLPGADERPDSAWKHLRLIPLGDKGEKTYVFMDSLGQKYKFDKYAGALGKLVEGKVPVGVFDLDLKRLYSFNAYEKHRLGLGLQTNEKVSDRFSVGGWFGYGTQDKAWKYGAMAEVYFDEWKHNKLQLSYDLDLRDPGRLQVHRDLDKNLIRMFILERVDKVENYRASLQYKFGYLNTEVAYNYSNITPLYHYNLFYKGISHSSFRTSEASLNFRYAYAEKTTPSFGRYISTGTRFPIVYGKFTLGKINTSSEPYYQAVGAISWHTDLNRWGKERFLLMAGGSASSEPLPLSKLFAANGFQTGKSAIHVFGGMQTMRPFDYYMDRFVNFYWKHDFHFHFFKAIISKKRGITSVPSPGIGYNFLWGKLANPYAHQNIGFLVPNPAYHEAGFMINRIIRFKYLGLYHLGLNVGYFYHVSEKSTFERDGRIVLGASFDL